MIQHATFLGISLRTQAHRRALVIGYYAFLLLFLAIPLLRHKLIPGYLVAQTFTLGAMLGGIKAQGPVKYFGEQGSTMDPDRLNPISLNLSGRYSPFKPAALLDERERATRDHAHYVAYRIVLLTLVFAAAALVLTASWTLGFVEKSAPMLLWGLCLYVMSLPQAVILWTEPEPLPEGGLTLVDAKT